jgi:hypothetical protein
VPPVAPGVIVEGALPPVFRALPPLPAVVEPERGSALLPQAIRPSAERMTAKEGVERAEFMGPRSQRVGLARAVGVRPDFVLKIVSFGVGAKLRCCWISANAAPLLSP